MSFCPRIHLFINFAIQRIFPIFGNPLANLFVKVDPSEKRMRQIKTFILHLYTGRELNEKTCGNLQALPGRKTFPFKDNTELLNLLKYLSNEEAKKLNLKNSPIEEEPNFSDSKQNIE